MFLDVHSFSLGGMGRDGTGRGGAGLEFLTAYRSYRKDFPCYKAGFNPYRALPQGFILTVLALPQL